MKHLNTYITEYIIKKKLDKPIDSEYQYYPNSKEELTKNIQELISNKIYDFNCIDTSEITDMSSLFGDIVNNINKINFDVSKWDVSNVTNMAFMFVGCESFEGKNIENWDVSNVENMASMFNGCKKFTGKNIEELLDKGENDLNCINTDNITDMSHLFDTTSNKIIKYDFKNIYFDISDWDVSNVKNMNYMFVECNRFNCDLSKWNVSNLDNVEMMFCNCKNFTGKGLENWNVSNIKNMSYMFYTCYNFTGETIENWNVSNVENMEGIFWGCENFNGSVSGWNVSKIKDMSALFYGCNNFIGNGLENWDVSNVENMQFMFYDCKKLNCDLSKWNVSNVTDMDSMFYNCYSLKNTPSWYKE